MAFSFYDREEQKRTPRLATGRFVLHKRLVAGVGQQSQMSGAFNCYGQLTLMLSTSAGNSARNDFRSLRQASSDFGDISVIADVLDFVSTESAYFFTAFSAATSLRSFHECEPPSINLVKR